MTDVAVIGFAQSPCVRCGDGTTSGVEMLVPIFHQVLAATGLAKEDIGFWCSGSSDYLAGRAFSFVQAVDAIGDLALAGAPLIGAYHSVRGGHKLNHAVLSALMADPSAWTYVEMPEVVRRARGHAELAAGFAAPAYGPDVS